MLCAFHQLLKRLTDGVTHSSKRRSEIVAKHQTILLNLGIDRPVRRLLSLNLARDTSRRDAGELEADIPLNIQRRDLFQVITAGSNHPFPPDLCAFPRCELYST